MHYPPATPNNSECPEYIAVSHTQHVSSCGLPFCPEVLATAISCVRCLILPKPLTLRSTISMDWGYLLTPFLWVQGPSLLWGVAIPYSSLSQGLSCWDSNQSTCLSLPLYLNSLRTQSLTSVSSAFIMVPRKKGGTSYTCTDSGKQNAN